MVEPESFDDKNSDDNAELSADRDPNNVPDAELPNADIPVVAELDNDLSQVKAGVAVADFLKKPHELAGDAKSTKSKVDFDRELQNMSAIGGAVGGFVLGAWSIICSLITFFGFINAWLAIALGIYGLTSSRRGLAVIGIILGICGLFMSLMEFNQVVGEYFLNQQDDVGDF